MPVVTIDVLLDFGNKFFDTFEGSAADGFLGDGVEPDLNLIKPRGVGWGVVNVPSFMGGKPALDFRMFVRGIVINDDVHIKLLRNVLLDVLEERQVLLMPMSTLTLGQDRTIGDVQRSKKGCGAKTFIVVGDTLNISQTQR